MVSYRCLEECLDDLFIVLKGFFEVHLDYMDQVLTRLLEVGREVNATKSYFEYSGCIVNREGVKRSMKKVEASSFIGMVYHFRDLWPKRSELLATLSTVA